MTTLDALPTTEDGLRQLVATLELSGAPFFDDDGAWHYDPAQGWPRTWYTTPRLADWREGVDTRYEGRELAEHATAALAEGRLPGHLADEPDVHELFKDNSGNVYFQLPALRTPGGDTPVLFFDHDRPWQIVVRARTVPELFAAQALEQWMDEHTRDDALRALIDAAVPIAPASLHAYAEAFDDGWREALGLPPRSVPLQRPRPQRPTVTGSTLGHLDTLEAFEAAATSRFILARAVDGEALVDLLRPLQWWRLGVFTDLDDALRNVMARTLSLASQGAGSSDRTEARRAKELLEAATFLDGLLQKGEVRLLPHQTPAGLLRGAIREALTRLTGSGSHYGDLPDDDGVRLLDTIPPMKAFHDGWTGIVADEVLAQGDTVAFLRAEGLLAKIDLLTNTAYNLIRRCGDDHLEALSATLPDLLPADQVMVLHGLDNFPRHPDVLALYEKVLADTPHDYVRRAVTRYRDRVASGIKPSGWES